MTGQGEFDLLELIVNGEYDGPVRLCEVGASSVRRGCLFRPVVDVDLAVSVL